jgi:outer membrane protein assembly factor BamB
MKRGLAFGLVAALAALAGCGNDNTGGDAGGGGDLAGRDLAGRDLAMPTVDLAGADLAGADLTMSTVDMASSDMAMPPPSQSVTQRGNGRERLAQYVQPTLDKATAAKMARDLTFDGTLTGHVYGQPLYVQNGVGGKGTFYVATESDNVTALDETTGAQVWTKNLGTPATQTGAGCGNISPIGVTGTPIIDETARILYVVVATGNATTIQTYNAHALSLDDGSEKTGWPVDLNGVKDATGALTFNPVLQNQRGALALVGGILYIPFGGQSGDCGNYHGWVIGIDVANPTTVKAVATTAAGSGAWAAGGPSSDGTNVFVTTGNAKGANGWQMQEAVLRLQAGPVFSGMKTDYWAPTNYAALDSGDIDIGGTNSMVLDVPGATPSTLVMAQGKDGNVYLNDRNNLTGVANAIASSHVIGGEIINVPSAITTANGTFVTITGYMSAGGAKCPNGQSGDLVTIQIGAANPPTITTVWCKASGGMGSPIVTTTDGKANAIVWNVGAEGDNKLHGWDAETGAVVFGGGAAGDTAPGAHRFSSPIAVHGRIFTACDGKLYAFKPM